jgi:DNA-binding response OmpR family regulator
MTCLLWIGQKLEKPIAVQLAEAGYPIEQYGSLSEGYESLRAGEHALVALHLSEEQYARRVAQTVCRKVRHSHASIPILLLSPSAEVINEAQAIRAGADACLIEPVQAQTVIACVKALLECDASRRKKELGIGDLTLCRDDRTVYRGSDRVRLTPREFETLWTLAEQPGQAVRKEAVLAVWGVNDCTENTVEVHIASIRRKLKATFGANPLFIQTIYGHGYRILTPEQIKPKAAPTQPSQSE